MSPIKDLQKELSAYSDKEKALIESAAKWAAELHKDQKRASGEPYIIHPLSVAQILASLGMDATTIIAAILHDTVEDTGINKEDIEKRFGTEVAELVEGVTKISSLRARNKKLQAAETIRKMLLAMVKDIRVILIKLADKLHNMRTLEYLPEEKRKRIARECLEIYAPLAERLGISSIKDELENLSLKHLNPDVYNEIEAYIKLKIQSRADFLQQISARIKEEAKKEGIKTDISTRKKHTYSIYNKMKKKSKNLDEIYDILGLRILCSTETECYTLLGVVHRLFKPIEGRFKDYIAMPKANKYQSLHTTVIAPGGKLVEIQIRTYQMHHTAEYGIAAHWLYKRGTSHSKINPEEFSIINRLREWANFKMSSGQFLEEIKREILKDSIYVFTPGGDVIELPKGATPIDFAYHIHTDIGDHISGAKANGNIIPISSELENTQVVEIMTNSAAHPNISWLRNVKTARARAKIRAWINKHDATYLIDKNIVAKKPQNDSPQQTAQTQTKKSVPDIDISDAPMREGGKIGVSVEKERNMLIKFARCCHPVTGDEIIGYVSRGRGIIVHRKDCKNLKRVPDFSQRKIEVEWESVSPREIYHVMVRASHSTNLFSEIEGAIRKFGGHLVEGKVIEQTVDDVLAYFSIEMDRKSNPRQVLKSMRAVPCIKSVTKTD